jgi:hypothetical protein
MSKWSHLPNAVHIDRVLASVAAHQAIWDKVYDALPDHGGWEEHWNDADNATYDRAAELEWYATWAEAWDGASQHAKQVGRSAIQDAITDDHRWEGRAAILALIAYDDCGHYLELSSQQLQFIADLSGHPAPRLLLSAVIAFELERNLEQS